MSKISNTTAYPTTAPADGDLLIGTDINDSNATKTFTISSIVALAPADTLSEVLTAGNTATNDINLTGNITLTNGGTPGVGSIVMSGNIIANTGTVSATGFQASSYFQGALLNVTDIQDGAGNTGTAGQSLVKSAANALEWGTPTVPANTLAEVLAAGNTATNNINLTGQINLTGAIIASGDISGAGLTGTVTVTTPTLVATDIQDNATLNGTAGQYLRKSGANALAWETVADPTLSSVLTTGNTATNNITLTGDISCTNITISTQSQAQRYIATDYVEADYLKGSGANALRLPNLNSFADNAAAVAGGLSAGDVYQTDGTAAAPLNVAGILMVRQ
tara:strand:+ start:1547 stop:2554 length:1008 start_codon:yes stop_codon:yes gene_type:complete